MKQITNIFTVFTVFTVFTIINCIAAHNTSCDGIIGDYNYTLEHLANATNNSDQIIKDRYGNIYIYHPCSYILSRHCATFMDSLPAVCQRDNRTIQQYHDCGSANHTKWFERISGADTGFFIEFRGGEENRSTLIEFICDKVAGIGNLKLAQDVESPKYYYHLQWRSKYVCPM